MSYLLSSRKNNFITTIKTSDYVQDKEDKLAKIDIKYKKFKQQLLNNRQNDHVLENMRRAIENFSDGIDGKRRRGGDKNY